MLKRFSKYICQSVAAMIGQSVYILADTFFISFNSGANGLAALNLILPVFGIMFAIGSMIGIGSATRYGISKAKGEDADHYFTQSISWSLVCSVPFILIGILTPDKFLALLGADAGLVELGKTYLRIVLIFAPFFMCNYSVTAFARNDNATSTVMACNRFLSGSDYAGMFYSLSEQKMQYWFQMEKIVSQTSDFLLSAWCVSICRRNFFCSDHVHIQYADSRTYRKYRSCCLRCCSKYVTCRDGNHERYVTGGAAADQ